MPDRYIKFGPAYRRFRALQTQLVCGCGLEDIPADDFRMMLFATTMLHERAGTNPTYPSLHQMALRKAVEECGRTFSDCVLEVEDFPEAVWRNFEQLCDGKANKTHTYGPVAGTLKMLKRNGTASLLTAMCATSPEEAWTQLDDLKGMGPKLSSFVLREFQTFFNVWPSPDVSMWHCFMPIDRWVLRVAKLTWPDASWPDVPPEGVRAYRTVARQVAERCASLQRAMEFNMGAWFLNAMRSEILACHGQVFIGDWEDDTLHLIAGKLDADRLARALTSEIRFQ